MASRLPSKVLCLVIVGITVLVVTTAVSTLGLISISKTVHNSGTIKTVNVGVYWNSACTNETMNIEWGTLPPGSVSEVSVYVRNEGSVPLRLSLSTQNWSPTSASSYIRLSWNKEGQTLGAANWTPATLTLDVSSSISGVSNFSFDIVISGTE